MPLANYLPFSHSTGLKGNVPVMKKAVPSLIGLFPLLALLCFTPASGESATLSEDLYSFQLLIDGEKFTLPIPYERMEEAGWKYSGTQGELLRPEQHSDSAEWEKNGVLLSAEMVNPSWDVLPVESCVLGTIELDSGSLGGGTSVLFPNEIALGTSRTMDVQDAYGVPSSVDEGRDSLQYTYHLDYNQEAVFSFQQGTGILRRVYLRNVIQQAPPSFDLVSADSPPSVDAYQTPGSLGDDPLSFRVKYAGVLYALPAPVSAFLNNGWSISEDNEGVVKAYGTQQVTLSLNGMCLSTWVYNNSERAAFTRNCLVTTVVSDVDRLSIPLVLPGGIEIGMDGAAALALFTELPIKDSKQGSTRRSLFGKSFSFIALSINEETGVLTRIEVVKTP